MRTISLFYVALFSLIPTLLFAGDRDKDKKQSTNKVEEADHQEHHFELEMSYNDANHFEFTGSVYFAHLTKFQGTVEFTGHHYAAVLVRELPFRHSKFGTFFGVGTSFGFEKEHMNSEIGVHESKMAPSEEGENEWETNLIVQSGLAYSIDSHWSTGFTVSPGYCFQTHDPIVGMTLDLVFAF
ncbi:hypothetical protein [Sediminitomix flava]|uniref:Outer membrane protein with beta-barrel domain n=1 Tax=Sediminitomix flava TaxID=379075 RepID=A0A315ZFW0_SEDFL|nr:hypothetical protein [Sediminitomix flava]PWJ44039.1 hypothetical protein BC781_101389 [Sediminitomix flava]